MALVKPPPSFSGAALVTATMPSGHQMQRIYLSRYKDPLGFGKRPSRFSDPRPLPDDQRFGVLYLGEDLKGCFLEAVLRDQRDGVVGDLPIAERELRARRCARIEVSESLRLVDLRGDGPIAMGVPSDAVRAADQALARQWSLAFHEHPSAPDGIIYPSRLNGQTNVAVYNRAVGRLRCTAKLYLMRTPGLAAVLRDLRVALV